MSDMPLNLHKYRLKLPSFTIPTKATLRRRHHTQNSTHRARHLIKGIPVVTTSSILLYFSMLIFDCPFLGPLQAYFFVSCATILAVSVHKTTAGTIPHSRNSQYYTDFLLTMPHANRNDIAGQCPWIRGY